MDDDAGTTAGERMSAHAIQEEGEGRANFDPTPYMRQLRGRGGSQEYLDVKWRLLWLRREHPNAQIVTEHVKIDETSAIFKATVSIETGGRATGYGSETAGDFGDFIEKAETKAIGRALNALGYGAQFAEGDEDVSQPAPSRPASAARPHQSDRTPDSAPIPMNTVATPVAVPSEPPPEDEAAPREMARATPPGTESRTTSEADDVGESREPSAAAETARPPDREADLGPEQRSEPEPEMADYSHSAFWDWARPRGYQTREDVEQAIGRSMKGQTPKEVRRMLIDAGAEP